MLLTILIILNAVLAIISIVSLILYGYHPSKSLGWLLVIVTVPYVGVLLYIMFGINRRKIKFLNLKETTRRQQYHLSPPTTTSEAVSSSFSGKKQKLIRLIKNSTEFFPQPGNEIELLLDGERTFEVLFQEIEKAKQFIHLQYYIIEEGELLDQLYELLKIKIEEGVEVRITYDAVGGLSWSRKSVNRFKEIGVKVFPLMPFKFGSLLFTINYRNHRKIAVIDGVVAFTGGVNISDKYIKSTSELGIWDDMHLCVKGPAATSLHRVFIKDYYFASKGEDLQTTTYLPEVTARGNSTVQVVVSGPDSDHAAIMQQYLMLIALAERSIYIANSYFIPNVAILEALKMISMSGIQVKLLIPRKNDSLLAKNSMYSYFESLLDAGVEIYRHNTKFLHSKVIVIDEEICSLGSGNFDYRSFEQNFEVNTMIYDEQLAKKIIEDIEGDIADSERLSLEQFKHRPLWDRFTEGLARLFSPLL